MPVISLAEARAEREPHTSGKAKCQSCAHEWVAVAPVGTYELECPECAATKGYYLGAMLRGEETFVCNCGCDVFRISPVHGPYCVNCATPVSGWF
mgnify:FL=1